MTTLLQYITVTILNAEKPNLNSWGVLATLSKLLLKVGFKQQFGLLLLFQDSADSPAQQTLRDSLHATSLSPNIKVNKLLLNRMQHNWLKSQNSSQE